MINGLSMLLRTTDRGKTGTCFARLIKDYGVRFYLSDAVQLSHCEQSAVL
jgi:hypothetical protein